MEETSVRAGRVRIPARELSVRFTRAGGPGGQNVNKRATRVEVTFDVGASRALTPAQKARARARLGGRLDAAGRLRVVARAARTQRANRDAAIARLAGILADALRPPPAARRPTRPTGGSVEGRLRQKKARSAVKRLRRAPSSED